MAVFRSTLANAPIDPKTACMVLDTMGELCDFYAAATIAHVGVDHNVLEPLGFGKPVTVDPDSNTTYPSYPLYRLLMDAHTLTEVITADQLARSWLGLICNAGHSRSSVNTISDTLAQTRSTVARHLDLLSPWM